MDQSTAKAFRNQPLPDVHRPVGPTPVRRMSLGGGRSTGFQKSYRPGRADLAKLLRIRGVITSITTPSWGWPPGRRQYVLLVLPAGLARRNPRTAGTPLGSLPAPEAA